MQLLAKKNVEPGTKAFQLLWAVTAIKRATFSLKFSDLHIACLAQTVCDIFPTFILGCVLNLIRVLVLWENL